MVTAAISALLIAPVVSSQTSRSGSKEPDAAVEEVIVFGRSIDLIGSADAASEGSVGGADLLIRPLVKTAELLESMPGMVAVQHSGSGKANQYFLRGFNLDHGTDYTVRVDGMPWNLRSHGHGQGYLDVNGLIPETVERIDYRKGPYRADLGDFSMAGASFIRTIDELSAPFVSAEVGDNGWRRLTGGMSHDVREGTLTLVGELKQYDGPWEQPENLEHYAIWGKYRGQTGLGELSLTVSGYEADWKPTEQIPERSIGSIVCEDAFCSLEPTSDGRTSRWIVNAQLLGASWDANLYAQYYDWSMSSNPTYDFQINQFDRRWTLGGYADYQLIDEDTLQVTLGGDFRYDDIGSVGLDQFDAGRFVASISDNAIKEGSLGLFLDAVWHVTDKLRLMGGLRGDHYDFDVTAKNLQSFAGRDSTNRASPKAGLAYAANAHLELYGNWGKGFHSNDARGVVGTLAPVPGLSGGTGYESGARVTIGDLRLTAAYWWLNQDSELIFIGDSNSVEPKGGSRRRGAELTVFWQPQDWLGIDAVWAQSRARFTDNPEGRYVEGAVEQTGQLGITLTRETWDASVRMRYLGPYALLADNSERADSLTTVNLRGARHWGSLTLYAELINLLDTNGKEIAYDYPAYVDGFDPPGLTSEDIDCAQTDCRMSRATEPRAIRVGVGYKF
jgi:outer membrane receptor protein involved in Fe transport